MEIFLRFMKAFFKQEQNIVIINISLHYWELLVVVFFILVFTPPKKFWIADFNDTKKIETIPLIDEEEVKCEIGD